MVNIIGITQTQLGCCFGGLACRCCCSFCPKVYESTTTRIMYTILILFGTLLMVIVQTPLVINFLIDRIETLNTSCIELKTRLPNAECHIVFGYMATYRLAFAQVLFFLLFAILTSTVRKSSGILAGIHNGFWVIKYLMMIVLCSAALLMPSTHQDYFSIGWMYVALIGALLFILVQNVLIIDLLHRIAKKGLIGRYRCLSFFLMVSAGFILYSVFVIIVLALLVKYAIGAACLQNRLLIALNASLAIIASLISILPCADKSTGDPRSGIFQSSLFCLYIMFQTWTAIISAPVVNTAYYESDNFTITDKICMANTSLISANVQSYICIVIILILALYDNLSISKKTTKTAGVNQESEIRPDSWNCFGFVGEHDGQTVLRNDFVKTTYSYPLFHIVCALVIMYIMMNLTNWFSPMDFRIDQYGKSVAQMYVSTFACWLCILTYVWSLLFPRTCPVFKRWTEQDAETEEEEVVERERVEANYPPNAIETTSHKD